MRITTILMAALLAAMVPVTAIFAQPPANFSGTWKQNNERCDPKRTGDVTLLIERQDPKLTVETTILRGSDAPRHAIQSYTTDGLQSISIGVDGDEFHTSVVWRDQSLIFTVEEHEDGRIIRSKEIWTLIDDGSALKRVREDADSGKQRTLVYTKISPNP